MRWWQARTGRAARTVGRRDRQLASTRSTPSGAKCRACGCSSTPVTSPTGASDPCELLDLADHVQLRQGRPGHTQVHVDDPPATSTSRPCSPARRARLPRPRLSVEYFDLPENGWPLDDPAAWARDLAGHVRALMRLTGDAFSRPSAGQGGSGRPAVGMPSNATTRPGSASVTNSVRRSGPPKQQLVVSPSPSIGEEVDDRAVGVDDADAVLHGRRHVEATVGVETETVARASPEVFDHPLARTVGVHAQQPGLLDHHERAVGLERDPVAVREAVGEHGDRAVRRVLHHATGRFLGGGQCGGSVK